MYKKILVVLILFFAFWLRFWDVSKVPAGLYYDEIDAGYQARSLLETGKDYRNTLSPFFVNSFVDPRPPLPVYLTALSTAFFKSPELQVRMGSVIVGTINVGLVFILLWLWSRKFFLSLTGMVITAINPWWLQFARFNHEANIMTLTILVGLICLAFAVERRKFYWWLLSIAAYGLGMYTYRTMSLFSFILVGLTVLIYFNQCIPLGIKKIVLLAVVFLIITVPFIYVTTFAAADKPRIGQISIFSDPSFPIQIQRSRELDSGDLSDAQVGKTAAKLSYFFHNKPVSFMTTFLENYYSAFSVNFLFTEGDKNHRQMISGQGMLYYLDSIAISFGLYYLFKKRNEKQHQLLLWLFFLSPIPSALTQDGASHGARMFVYSLPLLLVVSYGWYFFYLSVKKDFVGKFLILVASMGYLLLFIFYIHNYHTHFAIDSGRWYGSPYKQAMHEIMQQQGNYDHIVMVPHPDPPNLYLLFWGNIPPKEVQIFGSNFNEPKNDGSFLDRFKIADLPKNTPDLIASLKPRTLYLVTQEELREDLRNSKKVPDGINLQDVITYPDKEVAFYLIAKKDATESAQISND